MATGPDGIRAGPVTPAEIIAPLTPSGDVRQEIFHRSMQQMLGQQLQGQVVSRLADGSFLVNVNGATARMQLPEGAKAGDTLPMTLATLTPRPTFTLGQEHGSATVVVLQEPASEELTYGRQPGAAGLRRQPDTPAAARAALQAASSGETETSAQAAQLAASGQLDDDSLVYNPRAPITPAAGQLPEGAAGDATPAGAANSASGPANANAAAALARAVMARAPGLPSLPDDGSSAQTMLSDAGRLINQVLQAARDLPSTIIGKTPVLDSPDAPPAQMAAALQETLDRSGVFYESHLRQWADGKLALTELAREPQAAGAPARAAGGAGQAAQDGAPAFPQLVNLQLNTLEQHSVQWNGQVWPGQQMQWEVRQQQREAGSHDGGADDDARAWQSSMRFQFPLLGQIAATIHLVGGAVHVEVRAASEESAALLREGSGALADALDAAGSPLHSFMVKHDDAA